MANLVIKSKMERSVYSYGAPLIYSYGEHTVVS